MNRLMLLFLLMIPLGGNAFAWCGKYESASDYLACESDRMMRAYERSSEQASQRFYERQEWERRQRVLERDRQMQEMLRNMKRRTELDQMRRERAEYEERRRVNELMHQQAIRSYLNPANSRCAMRAMIGFGYNPVQDRLDCGASAD